MPRLWPATGGASSRWRSGSARSTWAAPLWEPGSNAERAYIYAAIEELQAITGLGVSRAENSVDVTQNADVFVEVSGLVKAAAVNVAKIAGDLRLLSAGPRGGMGEIRLKQLQAGSSIMPGR